MSNIRTAMNRGAFDFVTKPIDFQDLQTTINKTMRHIELLRDARQRQAVAERACSNSFASCPAVDGRRTQWMVDGRSGWSYRDRPRQSLEIEWRGPCGRCGRKYRPPLRAAENNHAAWTGRP
jgi:YesN/AraC family two-component response regulator